MAYRASNSHARAKIGIGVIVGARSMVYGKLPNFTLAIGSPAEVVDEDIYWKA